MALTDLFLRNLKPPAKSTKYPDGGGMYLFATPTGLKSWRFNYKFEGHFYTLTLGKYPLASLKEAREKLAEAKKNLEAGVNPCVQKKAEKNAERSQNDNSFEVIAREWFENKKTTLVPEYSKRIWGRIEKDLLPFLSIRQISEITALELLEVLRKIESRGSIVTAHRCLQYCGQVFRYAIATGRMTHDISTDLKGALKPATHDHMASLTDPNAIGGLLRAIDGYSGNPIVKLALQIAPYVFVRPGELRHAEWAEFDFDKAEWRIPADKMKMKQIHIVPLATQVINIMNELRCYSGTGRYLFPSMRTNDRPISDMTLLAGLRRLGFSKEEMTVHGFRSIASTILNEKEYNRDWIERQLAHSDHGVRASYNYADYLSNRRIMMQEWADYLDTLR
ncbi:MAG: integrase arm-type DNA-binding domain-containing protein [Deltaproteobacteria bacterium]|nr:integrase arm-type DNA-binding domain-containing protein [Deltaproteobacteria bacterium]